MADRKYSIAIRIVTGLLGMSGVASIGYRAVQDGSLQPDALFLLMLFAKLWVAYIFLHVTFFGTSPRAVLEKKGDHK